MLNREKPAPGLAIRYLALRAWLRDVSCNVVWCSSVRARWHAHNSCWATGSRAMPSAAEACCASREEKNLTRKS
jgi:hypothetical protein